MLRVVAFPMTSNTEKLGPHHLVAISIENQTVA